MSLQAPVAEGDVLAGASAADATSEPATPLHSTDMRDRSEQPTQSALAKPDRATVLQSRSRTLRDAGASAAKYGNCVDTSIFLFASRKSHQKLSETR